MEEKYLSDEQIEKQYENFVVENISVSPLKFSDGFSGSIEVSFPNADHSDFDNWVCDNWISYDSDGKKIAFDRWYPTGVYLSLCKKIREKIKNAA